MSQAEILVQNTLSGKKEKLQTMTPGEALVYLCGPTVYGLTHVGNCRAALTGDLIVRVLKLAGYKSRYARNITDVDDKIIKVANDLGKTPQEIADKFTKIYLSEMKALGNLEPDLLPTVTDHMPQIIEMVQGLEQKGLAYAAETPFGKDVYFRVKKFPNYGCLSHRKTDDMLTGTRVEAGEAKEDVLDFALWKAAKPGEPSWESPWGGGRPGWHIECSAMVRKHFPKGLDIHAGGNDLIFPHHENEIAQSEGLDGHPLAKYWVHNGMLTLGREKMSKSVGNIFTTQKFLELYGAETLRLMVLQHHYRGPMDFSEESIVRAEGLLQRLYKCKEKFDEALKNSESVEASQLPNELKNLSEDIKKSLFDDFNSAKALGFVLKAARLCFREEKAGLWKAWGEGSLLLLQSTLGMLTQNDAKKALEGIHQLRLSRMGLTQEFCQQIDALLHQREEFRAQKNFAESDRLRGELEAKGLQVMDGPDGATWEIKRPLEA